MTSVKFITNKGDDTVANEIKLNLDKSSKLSIISAYFTIYAFYALKDKLQNIEHMRFIYTEPTYIKDDDEQMRQYEIESRISEVSGNEYEIKMKNQMTGPHVAKVTADWIREKAIFKSVKKGVSVSKKFVMQNNSDEKNMAVMGEMNFTSDNLGLTQSNRSDGYPVLFGKDMIQPMLYDFEAIWSDDSKVADVTDKVLEQIELIYRENSPEWIYFVSLYNVFEKQLGELVEDNILKKGVPFKETVIWNKLYKFQQDGVIGAIDKLEKYNGCILADSVGLGKTFSALAVIKYYELRNDRVLVLCPKKLRDNWTVYTQNDKRNILVDDRFGYDVLHHTDLSRYDGFTGDINLKTINWNNYDLVVIDESHNFRNDPAVKQGKITRYQRLMNDIIKTGVKTKVLMLSATPVNNGLTDLKNQIAFITEGNDRALIDYGIPSIDNTLRKAQTQFNVWDKLDPESRSTRSFVESVNPDYFKLLDLLTIARSRKHIQKYYNQGSEIRFPNRLDPVSIKSDIDTQAKFPDIADVNETIRQLTMSPYRLMYYVLPHKRRKYEEMYDTVVRGGQSKFTQADREIALAGLISSNLLKRLESSIYSFTLTLERMDAKIVQLLNRIDAFSNGDLSYIHSNDSNLEEIDDLLLEDLLVGNKDFTFELRDMDLIKWKDDLEDDHARISLLLEVAKAVDVERDQKLKDLKELIQTKVSYPINEGNKKIILFTAFADTAEYLYENLAEGLLKKYGLHSALVTGAGGNKTNLKGVRATDLNDILLNFSPRSKERNLTNSRDTKEIDILIATDCISEGQNLQDCDYLINYDIHWNPVRVIQRFGRIDRIGSQNEVIQLVNFWPNMELDEYINLEQRVKGRMVLLDTSATGEENILESGNGEMNDLKYRAQQLRQLQTQVLDLEDINGTVSITDLTFNDYKSDLMAALKTRRHDLEKAPKGMYAIADASQLEESEPGVIFLLKQKDERIGKENSILPYLLMYITDEGEAKIQYTDSKRILDCYKKLCLGNDTIYQELVDQFNKETDFGSDMLKYSQLLTDSLDIIQEKKAEVGMLSLFNPGGTTMKSEKFEHLEDVELISFLIIKEG